MPFMSQNRFRRVRPLRALLVACVLLSSGAAISLVACGVPQPRVPDRPEVTFDREPGIAVDVGRVEASNRYIPPLKPPNVEHDFPVSIAGNARRWAEDRIRPEGGDRLARFTVENASAVLAPDGTVVARISARLEVVDVADKVLAETRAEAQSSARVDDELDHEERLDAYYALEKDLLARFDAAMEAAIRRDLAGFVR
jgi:hypothetical protein